MSLVTAGATATFASKNTASNIAVTVAGLTIAGAQRPTTCSPCPRTTANITARPITVTAATSTKTYDGTTSSTATPAIASGNLVTGDAAAFSETFDTRNVGTGKTLTPAGSVNDGNGGGNYAVTFVANTAGSVTPLAIIVSAATATKVYDGTTSSTATPAVTLLDAVSTLAGSAGQLGSRPRCRQRGEL